jgi:hypothetical protein
MSKQVIDLELILAKLQSSFGTMVTPLTTADYIQAMKPTLDMDVPATKVESIGVRFGQDASIIGPREISVNRSFPLRSSGVQDSPGDWSKYLQCSGFVEDAQNHVYTYTPAVSQTEWKDLTEWAFTGAQGASDSLRRVLSNLLFSAKISLDLNTGYGQIDFMGKGVFNGLPEAQTQPVPLRKSLITPNLLGATVDFFGGMLVTLLSFNIDIANEITVCNDPATPLTGYKGFSYFTDQKIKWDAKIYVDSESAFAGNPHDTLIDGTYGALSIVWGTAPNLFTLLGTNLQIESVKESEQNKIKTYDLSGIFVDNAMSLAVNTTSA